MLEAEQLAEERQDPHFSSWRAVAWLAAFTALFAIAFHFVGFAKPPQPASY
jgi:hypothetical protein